MTISKLSGFLLIGILMAFCQRSNAQLTVNTAPTPTQLVQNILLGTGVSVANITFSGDPAQKGSFNCAGPCNTTIGIGSGVMLTSGSLSNAIGPNNSTGAGTDTPAGSDIDLNGLNPGGSGAQDAAVLQFDFTPATDSVRFRYVWASEEYSDYVNSNCNDFFGFFVNGPGITGKKNIALVPNSTTAISINTVNNGWAAGGTSPNGPCTNCAYFRDNHGSASVQYDGLTTVLTAGTAVCPCETYHIKLAVQDFCDGAFDSGVFLEANSFSSNGFNAIPIIAVNGNYTQIADTIFICPGDSVQIGVDIMNNCRIPNWNTGDTTFNIWASQPGGYYCSFVNLAPFCFASSPVMYIAYAPSTSSITANGPVSFCPGDSVVLTATPGSSYLWSNGATSQSITVFNPGNYSCTVNAGGACISQTNVITVSNLAGSTLTIATSGTTTLCQGQTVTLTSSTPSVSWSTGATTQSITVNSAGTYTATPTAAGFCPAPSSVTVAVNPNPTVTVTGTTAFCQGGSVNLGTSTAFTNYNWSNGQTTSTINVTSGGSYAVTVTDVNGCTANNNLTVTMNALPSPAISGDFDFCQGIGSNITATAGFNTYAWSTGANTSTINVSFAGNYTVTVTDANGCSNSTSQLITVYNNPLPFINGTTAICQGANANLVANPAGLNYVWSTGSTSSSIQPATASTYTVTVTDGNGCSGTASQLVNVNANPTPAITGSLSVCTGSTSALAATAGYTGYLWSTGDITAGITANTSGNYTVTVSDANGCTGSTSVNFTVLPFTPPTITGPAGFCQGNNALIDAGAGYAGYIWSNGAISQQQTITNGGAYTVTVTAANGCTGSTSFNTSVWALPTPVIGGITAVCNGNAASLQVTPAGLNYLWSDGSTAATLNTGNAGTYTVTVTDANGCSANTSQAVTINANPTATITGQFDACQGASGTLDAAQSGISSYLWSNGANSATIQPTTAGTYTVTITDGNGCTGTTSQLFSINALPTPAISGPTAFCAGQSVTLASTTSYAAYSWSTGDATLSTTINNGGVYTLTVTDGNGCNGSTTYNVTANALPQPNLSATLDLCDGTTAALQPGAFSSYIWSNGATTADITVSTTGMYTVTVTDINGCENSTGSNVIFHANPDPVIKGDSVLCDGESGVLTVVGSFAGYQWSTGSATSTLIVTTPGSYSVTVTDTYGCKGNAGYNVTVHPRPLAEITGDLDICTGEQTRLDAVPGQGGYQWSTGGNDPYIIIAKGGVYTVIVTNQYGCTKTASATVNEHPVPVVDYTPVPQITCDNLKVKFDNNSAYEQGSVFTWDFGDGVKSNDKSPTHIYLLPGDYLTHLSIVTAFGCSDEDSSLFSITIPPLPEAKFTQSSRVVSVFNSEISFDNKSEDAVRYKWSFGDGNSSEEVNPKHIFDQVGTLKIKLHAYNAAECHDEFETTLEVVPFFVPSAFTPNNDGKNDVFFDGVPYMNLTSFDMKVFNRWGQQIFSTDSFLRPWDGFLQNGDPAPEGLYTYMIKIVSIKGKYYEYPGTFSLIR